MYNPKISQSDFEDAKKYVKEFFLRGMMFGGFGPLVAGIIYFVVSKTSPSFTDTFAEHRYSKS